MSLSLLEEHRQVWEKKSVLRDIYAGWFDLLLAEVPSSARTLEVGAGPGFLSAHARRARADLRVLSTDILPTPWQDVAADCLRLPFSAHSIGSIVGIDVVHHLARPARFFSEAARVLVPGGKLAVVEPWVTPLSYSIYRWLHQEGCRIGLDPWDPFAIGSGRGKDAFQGDAAVLLRLVKDTAVSHWSELGFEAPRLRFLNGFAYLLSLGFKRGSLLPQWLSGLIRSLDDGLSALSPWLGMRVLAVWERRRTGHNLVSQ